MKYFISTMDDYCIFQWIYNEKLRKTIITLLKLWDNNTENNVHFVRCIVIINFYQKHDATRDAKGHPQMENGNVYLVLDTLLTYLHN